MPQGSCRDPGFGRGGIDRASPTVAAPALNVHRHIDRALVVRDHHLVVVDCLDHQVNVIRFRRVRVVVGDSHVAWMLVTHLDVNPSAFLEQMQAFRDPTFIDASMPDWRSTRSGALRVRSWDTSSRPALPRSSQRRCPQRYSQSESAQERAPHQRSCHFCHLSQQRSTSGVGHEIAITAPRVALTNLVLT